MSKHIETGKPEQLFEDFLRERGAYGESTEQVIKRVIAVQLSEAMKANVFSKRPKAAGSYIETISARLLRPLMPQSSQYIWPG